MDKILKKRKTATCGLCVNYSSTEASIMSIFPSHLKCSLKILYPWKGEETWFGKKEKLPHSLGFQEQAALGATVATTDATRDSVTVGSCSHGHQKSSQGPLVLCGGMHRPEPRGWGVRGKASGAPTVGTPHCRRHVQCGPVVPTQRKVI